MQPTPSYSEGQKLDLTKLINKSPTLLKFVDEAPSANVAGSVGRAFTDYTPLRFDAFGKAIENAISTAGGARLMKASELESLRKSGIGFKATPAGKDEETGEQLFSVSEVSDASTPRQTASVVTVDGKQYFDYGGGNLVPVPEGSTVYPGSNGATARPRSEAEIKAEQKKSQALNNIAQVASSIDLNDPKAVAKLKVMATQQGLTPQDMTQLNIPSLSQQTTQSSQSPDIVQATDGKFYTEDPNGHVEMRGKKYKPATDEQIAGMKRE